MAAYQARLTELVAAKAVHVELGHEHDVRNLNRQIQAQLKWISRAEALAH
jgi:hypothetical protein